MSGILYSDDPNALWTFLFFTVVLGGLGAWATGRAFAGTWRSPLSLPPALLVLAAAVRFLHYALGGEDLLSLQYYLIALVVVGLAAVYSFRACRAEQMVRQYPWLFARAGPLGWSTKEPT